MPYDNAPGLAGVEFFELFAKAGIFNEFMRGHYQGLHGACRRLFVDQCQKVVQTRQVRERFVGPFDFHYRGTGSGMSLFRLSAQIRTD